MFHLMPAGSHPDGSCEERSRGGRGDGPRSALAIGGFRLLLAGSAASTTAYFASTVAAGYAAFQLTGAATMLGLMSFALGAPLLLFALVGGVVADRLPRQRVLLASQTLLGACALVIATLSFAGLLAPWHLVVVGLAQGTAFAFNVPSRQALVTDLVGPSRLRAAVALTTTATNACRILGPAFAGLFLSLPRVGVPGVFAAVAAMYVLGIGSVAAIRVPPSSRGGHGGRATAYAQLIEGLAYIRSSPVLMALLALAVVPPFFGLPYQTLLPVFSETVFHAGATGLGMLTAATGVGALVGSVAVAALAGFSRPGVLQLGLGVGFGLALVAFGLAPSFPVAVGLLALAGFASAAYTALNNTLVMANSEPRLHGRVMSVYLLTLGVTPVAAFPMSWLADHVGAPLTVTLGGAIVAAVVAGVAIGHPPYRRIQ
jgi:MFS family permease